MVSKIEHAGVRRRAELLYQQLDGLQTLRRTLRPELLAESRKHKASKLLRQIPCIGPIRAARLIALMQTPHRFRSKRQLWTYSGLGIETRDSAPYRYVHGQLQRTKKPQQIRGLNRTPHPPSSTRYSRGRSLIMHLPLTAAHARTHEPHARAGRGPKSKSVHPGGGAVFPVATSYPQEVREHWGGP
jgi:transposase